MHSFRTPLNSFLLRDGISIAYQQWGVGQSTRVLALHGFLDNSNSFSYLGPYLAKKGCHVVAIDHVGHGWSSRIPAESTYQFSQYVMHVKGVLEALGWEKSNIVGHSMGGIITNLFSSTYPEKVEKAVFIEGLVPFTNSPKDSAKHLRKAIDGEDSARKNGIFYRDATPYESFGIALEARIRSAGLFPGNPTLSNEGALSIIQRGMSTLEGENMMDVTDLSIGPVKFLHDWRHNLMQYIRLSPEQALGFTNAIASPSLVIIGDLGIKGLFDFQPHMDILESKNLLVRHDLPGSHHLHLDPTSASLTAH
eukprot:gene9782-20343_t